ncbi:MAG: DNA-processing protein DprA [Nitrospiria bacterium]
MALKQVPGIGNVLYKRLIDTFKHPEAVFNAKKAALLLVEGLSESGVREIHKVSDFEAADRELDKIEKTGASLLSLNDPDYPALLAAIYDPPPILYVKGPLNEDCVRHPIAVVGSRKTSPYGKSVTEKLCSGLVQQGMTVVSGFARGIDGFAHRAALSAGGHTIAVLGCGIDCLYPPEHKRLYTEMSEQGTLLSEFPVGTPPEAHHFPQRNRIISGLSLGCLVVEASLKSGSLITARLALDQGREVFAVPGSVFSEMSAGPHRLIASGAKLVQKIEDILEEVLPQSSRSSASIEAKTPPLDMEEETIYRSLSFEPKHIDQLIEESDKGASRVSGLLLGLELKGAVRQMSGQYYVKI